MGADGYRTLHTYFPFASRRLALASSLFVSSGYRFYVLRHVQPWIGRVFHPRTEHIIVRLFPHRYQVKVRTK